MQRLLAVLLLSSAPFAVIAQTNYNSRLAAWQDHYKKEFLTDKNSPLKAADTGFRASTLLIHLMPLRQYLHQRRAKNRLISLRIPENRNLTANTAH